MTDALTAPSLTSSYPSLHRQTPGTPSSDPLQALVEDAVTARLGATGQLAASLLHELNNPLAIVLGNLEFARLTVREALASSKHGLSASPDLELLQQLLGDAEKGAQRIVDVVGELRPISRSAEAQPTAFDLADAARSALLLARGPLLHVADVEVELETGLVVHGNAGQLSQALLTLLLGAAEAMRAVPGSRHQLRLTARAAGNHALLRVTDTGESLPPTALKTLFDPLVAASEGKGRGGVSLCLVRETAVRHGGTLEADNDGSSGVTFTLTLPRARAAAAPAAA